MRDIEKTACDGGLLGVRRWGAPILLSLSCVTASAAFVAVEFGGRITYSDFGDRVGARVVGYFTYESNLPPGPQTASQPNLVFGIPEQGQSPFQRSSYNFYVYNNWPAGGEVSPRDGLALEFSYPGGYGWFSLFSSNISLFPNNNVLPPTIPALENFDAGRGLQVTVDSMQPYKTMAAVIDRLSVVPGSGLGQPVIFGVARTAGTLSFRFLKEPSTRYTVHVTANLAATSWGTLTNVPATTEPIAIINDSAPGLEKRFYRIRKD